MIRRIIIEGIEAGEKLLSWEKQDLKKAKSNYKENPTKENEERLKKLKWVVKNTRQRLIKKLKIHIEHTEERIKILERESE